MSIVKKLYRDYGNFVVDIPLWEISDVGITALWGASGSGKTSVFRLLIGLEPCASMSWEFKGEDLAKLSAPQRRLGVVFQSYELFPHMTARENICFSAEARGMNPSESHSQCNALIRELSLDRVADTKASVLSGGERQRVALGRALITKPRLLMLDEPFSALDESLRSDARKSVKKVIHDHEIPTLLITHDRRDIDELGASVRQIRDGRLVD